MKCSKEAMRLYAVTDRTWTKMQTLTQQVEAALKGGVTCLQLREKEMGENAFLEEAEQIKALCKSYQVSFIVNDYVDLAIKCGADGIHVGQQDMSAKKVREKIGEQMILGVSVRTVEQAIWAEKNGADYLGVGAVFSTSTKLDAKPVAHQVLKEICEVVHIPVVAIGGITKENMMQLKGTGVQGVALVSAIFASKEIIKTCQELKVCSEQMVLSE